MKTASRTITHLAAVAAILLASACGGGGGAVEDDSPEGRAYQFRHAVMELVASKNGFLLGMSRGEIPDDQAAFTKAAGDLAALSGMVLEGWETEGIAAGSRSLPDIWMNMADFEQKAQDFRNAAIAVAEAAASGDFARAKELEADVGPTCGACHRPYRAAAE